MRVSRTQRVSGLKLFVAAVAASVGASVLFHSAGVQVTPLLGPLTPIQGLATEVDVQIDPRADQPVAASVPVEGGSAPSTEESLGELSADGLKQDVVVVAAEAPPPPAAAGEAAAPPATPSVEAPVEEPPPVIEEPAGEQPPPVEVPAGEEPPPVVELPPSETPNAAEVPPPDTQSPIDGETGGSGGGGGKGGGEAAAEAGPARRSGPRSQL